MGKEWELILKALENPKYKWRTVDGITSESGLDQTTVVNSINANADMIIKSSIPAEDGKELFTTRDHYKKNSSSWNRLLSSLKNKVE